MIIRPYPYPYYGMGQDPMYICASTDGNPLISASSDEGPPWYMYPSVIPNKRDDRERCPYCGGRTHTDWRGNCIACGGPRED